MGMAACFIAMGALARAAPVAMESAISASSAGAGSAPGSSPVLLSVAVGVSMTMCALSSALVAGASCLLLLQALTEKLARVKAHRALARVFFMAASFVGLAKSVCWFAPPSSQRGWCRKGLQDADLSCSAIATSLSALRPDARKPCGL